MLRITKHEAKLKEKIKLYFCSLKKIIQTSNCTALLYKIVLWKVTPADAVARKNSSYTQNSMLYNIKQYVGEITTMINMTF